MKIKNPARHLPHYAVKVYLPDGAQINKRGSAQPEIDVPVEEDEYQALILECQDSARVSKIKLLLVNGAWVDFSEEVLAEMLNPTPVPDPVPPTPEETQRYEKQNREIEDERKPVERIEARTVKAGARKPVEREPVVRKLPKRKPVERSDEDEDGRYGIGCS